MGLVPPAKPALIEDEPQSITIGWLSIAAAAEDPPPALGPASALMVVGFKLLGGGEVGGGEAWRRRLRWVGNVAFVASILLGWTAANHVVFTCDYPSRKDSG